MTPGLHLLSLVEAAGGIAGGKFTSLEWITDHYPDQVRPQISGQSMVI